MLPEAWSWTLFRLISGSHYGPFFWRLLQFFGFVCTNDLDLSPPLPKMEMKISCSLISSSLILSLQFELMYTQKAKPSDSVFLYFYWCYFLFGGRWGAGEGERDCCHLESLVKEWRSHDLTFSVTSFQVLKCEYAVRGEIVTLAQVTKIYWLFIFGPGWYCCQSSRMICWINWLNE